MRPTDGLSRCGGAGVDRMGRVDLTLLMPEERCPAALRASFEKSRPGDDPINGFFLRNLVSTLGVAQGVSVPSVDAPFDFIDRERAGISARDTGPNGISQLIKLDLVASVLIFHR